MHSIDYKIYAKVFDYFSNPKFFPLLQEFITRIARYLPESAEVVDVGAGTGFFSEYLLQCHPSTQLTIVEPSEHMMPIAKKRVGERAKYLFKKIEKAIPILKQQDAFIFQRSLNAIYKNHEACQKLFCLMNKKLKMKGYLFIFEYPEKANPLQLKRDMYHFIKPITEKEEFEKNWQIFEEVLRQYNIGVDNGVYQLLNSTELDWLAKKTGFTKIYQENAIYIYQKTRSCLMPCWLKKFLGAV